MNDNPLVSVIIPTYNRAHLLPRAINSVLSQTYRNFELIIVDDGSTDNTEEVVKSFNNKRIVYHKHNQNKGVLAAKNTGWDLAKGKYDCPLDDDDELLPEALETAVNKFTKLSPEGVKILWFDCIDAETGKFSGSHIRKEGYISHEDVLCGRISGDYWMVRDMDLVGDNRFDERLWQGPSILWLKLYRKSSPYHVPKVLARAYREHGERISSMTYVLKHLPKVILGQKAFLEEYGEEIKRLCPKHYGQLLAALGSSQILNGEKQEGRKALRQSFKYGFLLRWHIWYLLSFIPKKNQIMFLYIAYNRFPNIKRAIASALITVGKLLSRTRAS